VVFWLWATSVVAQNSQEIRGTVVDSRTRVPLIGANAAVIPQGPVTATDAFGNFSLRFTKAPVEANNRDSLRISFMGYRAANLPISEAMGELKIPLEAITLLFSETIITATRQPALRAQAPAATELIEIGAPETVARQNLGEALIQSQSVFVKEYGGISGLKTINLRGASDGQVLVLEDGIRLNNPQNGGVDAGVLSLVGIDKIEIIRGNASAQYGSDAIGGVINLRSLAPPTGMSGFAQTSGGSFGAFNSRLQLGYGSERWHGAVAVDRLVSDGDYAIDDSLESQRHNNASQRREIFARLSGSPLENLQLNFLHRTGETKQGVPGSLQFRSRLARQKDLNHLTGAALSWRTNPIVQLSAQFSAERRDQHYDDPNPSYPFASRHQVASDIGALQNRAQLLPSLELLLGAELGNYRVESTNFSGINRERTQRSAFAQVEWQPLAAPGSSAWQIEIVPSLRYDDYSDAGHRRSPKLALVLNREAATRLSLHASAGRSFRVPSMNDLYWQEPFIVGNPNLRPERGREIEGGALYEFSRAGNWQLELAAFDSKIDDLILWSVDQSFNYSPVNLEDAAIRGVEATAAWRSRGDRLAGRAGYVRLSAKNDSQVSENRGNDLVYRPRDKFDLQAHADLRYLVLGGSLQLVGKRFANPENTKSLRKYRLVNFSIGRKFRFGEIEAFFHAEVRNVFDRRYQIIDGYPMPGREYRASLKIGN
jgi:outer membrane cobalamin receptor